MNEVKLVDRFDGDRFYILQGDGHANFPPQLQPTVKVNRLSVRKARPKPKIRMFG